MSRRREATDLARALELSTQSTTGPRSTPLFRDSSPPITPLPTKYMPQTPTHGISAAGGFMEQYHQQLQQAQSYYQRNNSGLLASASHSARNSYAQAPISTSRPAYPPPHQLSSGPKPLDYTSSKSTSHVSDSSRSIPGGISLPDSGHIHPVTSRDLELYPARRDFSLNTSSSSSIGKFGDSTGLPSSGIQTSTSGNTSINSAVPPAQQPRPHLINSITTAASSVSSNAHRSSTRPHIATGTSGPQPRSPADSANRPSMIRTAPLATPLSSASRAPLPSDPISAVSTFVSAVKSTIKGTLRQTASPRKMAAQNPKTGNAEDVVADSEGEEDGRDIVQGTQDDLVFGVSNVVPNSNLGGLGAGLMTPPVTDSNTTALPVSSTVAAAAVSSVKPAPIASVTGVPTTGATAPVSTRPKPRKKVKAPVGDVVTATTPPERKGTTPLPEESARPLESMTKNTTTSVEDQENGKLLKPLKTYGSKDKGVGASKRQISEPATVVNLTSTQAISPCVESSKRNAVQSKSRAIIDSDSELSDTPVNSTTKRKHHQTDTAGKADEQKVESKKQPLPEPKRTAKKRAIITSDDEDEYVQDKTPDSKRRKPEGDKTRSDRSSPKKKAEAIRGSSIDPLDMNVDAGLSGKPGQIEVSVELSPSDYVKFGLANDKAGNENDKSGPVTTKSPNKVHFVDSAPVNEKEIPVPLPKSKQPKSKILRQDDADDDEPEMYAAPADDGDDEDDFVPSGSKKSKAKAKTAKAKKAAPPKGKAAKGKKVSQAKGKNAKSVELIDEPTETLETGTIENVAEVSESAAVSSAALLTSTEDVTEPVAAIAEVAPAKPSTAKKGKFKKAAASSKSKSKSLAIVSDDEQPHNDAEAAQNDEDAPNGGGRLNPQTSLAVENKSAKQQTASNEVESTNATKTSVTMAADEAENAKQDEADEVAGSRLTTSKVLQTKTSVVLNTSANVKIEPSFVVDKNGNVKEFRTCRTDLLKVVQTTGGVKRMGFSRRTAIPSLHKSFKLPPKRLPPPPKKPSRKKEDSDDDSDELDENGKKKIRPGDPEWYMMDVD
ncbi:hypothetical protein QFC22_004350 [Naganishia vaughanmartiniae]|uniref:Uncharacterized protein n=1 Tax=Naganishia vaughanmartiniae TaxID=1424756 RepID=A0ACC2X1P9_9TREE|nr:hypothetical protein QFC22_004350 [Naganishia vaughanmartiniae]